MAGKIEQYLEQLLEIHWLRPETALWRTFDSLLLEESGIFKYSNKNIDLGCGDGTMSYLAAGGKIINYDVFEKVKSLKNYNKGEDIHNCTELGNINHSNADLRYSFDYGVDHKDVLVRKAKCFDSFYKNTLVQDLNEKLPFSGLSYDAAFSNILYWLNDIDKILKEWNRIIKLNGHLVLFVPNDNFKQKAWLYYDAPHSGDLKYLNFFDRGYNALIHHCYDSKTWEKKFNRNGFSVKKHIPYLSNPVMNIWNIGTRPLAPLLISMANDLSLESRIKNKKEWVSYFTEFFSPIIKEEYLKTRPENECAFHFYVLEKNA
jgi:SAM-dependent methyltransferase